MQAIRSKFETRQAQNAGWSYNGHEDDELDDESNKRVRKILADKAAKKSSGRSAKKARRSARKAQAKAMGEMTKKTHELMVATKPALVENDVASGE